MANRPIFISDKNNIGVNIVDVDFEFFTGFSISQKQKSIRSLHDGAAKKGIDNILEVSTRSEKNIGIRLSAFNLSAITKKNGYSFTVERAFQASKIFERGGPYIDILEMDSIDAKKDVRLKESGRIIGFKFFNLEFQKDPPTLFYDWLYINTLIENSDLIDEVKNYNAFSDIEFNPDKSLNCQAYSLALFISLCRNNCNYSMFKDQNYFYNLVKGEYKKRWKIKNSLDNEFKY